jgi:hypothetical protein
MKALNIARFFKSFFKSNKTQSLHQNLENQSARDREQHYYMDGVSKDKEGKVVVGSSEIPK